MQEVTYVMARPRSEAARQKMLDAATELALAVGVRAFTIEEVARRSGVAKTTIYRHFSSKNQLIIAALDGITPMPEVPDTGGLHDDLVIFLGNVLPIFASTQLRVLFLDVAAASVLDPELQSLQETMMAGRGRALTTIVERGKQRGEMPASMSMDLAVELIEGPMIIRGLTNPSALDNLDLDELVTVIIRRLNV